MTGFLTVPDIAVPHMPMFLEMHGTNRFSFTTPDHLEGNRNAPRHLLQQGADQIAFVGGMAGRNVSGFAQEVARTMLSWLEEGIVPQEELRTPVEMIVRSSSSSAP